MEKVLQLQRQVLGSRRLPLLVIGLTLSILALSIGWSFLRLREEIRAQVVNHDGEILQAVSILEQEPDEGAEELAGSLDDPAEQFTLMMRISRLKGVLGIRLFRPDGEFFNAFPAYISEAELQPRDLARLKRLDPVSHFYSQGRLREIDLLAEANGPAVPLLVVNVPLFPKGQQRLLGIAQFIIDGETIAHAYAGLDHQLLIEAAITFLTGGFLLSAGLALAFRRIRSAHRLLAERTQSLLRANQELALAARTSAGGAVTAHLIHGLKNPLSGLQSFVEARLEDQIAPSDTDWQEAVASTQRMQGLIREVVRVLEEQQADGDYEMSFGELTDLIVLRMRPLADAAGVSLTAQLAAEGSLSNRYANLLVLILENLIQNALQATPPGKGVMLTLAKEGDQIAFEVQDQGTGFPAGLQTRLFAPCHSTKPGGGGIGLAISKQLANHLGATLELESSTAQGCVFRLALPARMLCPCASLADGMAAR